jgi:hypothetical protein
MNVQYGIPIQLDHLNGKHFDNRIENLRLLCPNCYAQTDTYTGKNKGLKPHKSLETSKIEFIDIDNISIIKIYECIDCKKQLNKSGIMRCSRLKSRIVERPSYEKLMNKLKESNYLQLGKHCGVSDNCIRKWIKYYETSLKIYIRFYIKISLWIILIHILEKNIFQL